MSLVLVYPDQKIPRFFAQSPLTQQECNEKILQIFVEDFHSTFEAAPSSAEMKSTVTLDHVGGAFQGGGSYTVIIRSRGHMPMVGQYRKPGGCIDPVVLKDAVACYKNWVPEARFYELEEGQVTISPYAGTSFALQRLEYSLEQKLNSIGDFARFIACGWYNSRDSSQLVLNEIHHRLSIWRNWNLSDRISAVIDDVCANLEDLSQLPLVFTHADFNGLNVLSDANGHITGVIDWDASSWRPFGFGLYALETFLGSTGSEGYSRVDGYGRLRAQFFETLWSNLPPEISSKWHEFGTAIRLAELAGILHHYMEWHSDVKEISQKEIEALEIRLTEG